MKRVILISLLLLFGSSVPGGVIQVPGQYSTIQSAIHAAVDFDVIVVQPSIYHENINFLGKKVTVQSVDPNDVSIVAATVIDGSMPTDPNKASVVTFNSGEGYETKLSGFTITGGTGSWIPVSWKYQGLRWNRCGGGVICYNLSAPTIEKNVFIENSAGQGGAVYVYGDAVNDANPANPTLHINPIIQENTIIDNTALIDHGYLPPDTVYPLNDHGDGGAIVVFQGVDATIRNNLIQRNFADFYGGGIHCRQWSDGLIENNTITENNSLLGGGLHITYYSAPVVRSNIITLNSASNLGGGGVYIYFQSSPIIEMNLISQNSSTNGSGMAIFYQSTPVVRNNLIVKNNDGSGITMTSSSPEIFFNTIADNENTGIYLKNSLSNPVIRNNTIVSNGSGSGINVSPGNLPEITYNNVWGHNEGQYFPESWDLTGIQGNMSTDPLFVDPNSDNYHLHYNSLCIDAADPAFTNPSDLTDYDGNDRIIGPRSDMGAFEILPIWNTSMGGGYMTIQDAVNDSSDGDTLILLPGTYRGTGNRDIEFFGKLITLSGTDPTNSDIVCSTIIDCEGSSADPHRAFWFRGQETSDAVIQGIKVINGNGRYDGGAIKCSNNSNPTIHNCVFMDNLAGGRAGAIYAEHSSPVITNCHFENNTATNGYGGAIACFYDASPVIGNCVIIGNKAAGSDHHGGGICCWDNSNPTVYNCLVTANSADHRGGGLYAYWAQPIFVNCTVIGNQALEGGGICSFRESDPFIVNCIVRDNRSPDGNQLALINTSRVWAGTNIPTAMHVAYSLVQNEPGDVMIDPLCSLSWGDGIIDADPLFLDPGFWHDANTPAETSDDYFVYGDYHIIPTSPCYNTGDNDSIPGLSVIDIDGEPRMMADSVDMGADEVYIHQMDFNIDGIIDSLDLSNFGNDWLHDHPPSDFNSDGIVNLLDYASFASSWLWKANWHID